MWKHLDALVVDYHDATNGQLNPLLKTVASRMATFKGYDFPVSPDVNDLAEAGFFYFPRIDHMEQVKCFMCGLKLGGWEAGDNAWVEHVRWGKNCEYLRRVSEVCQEVKDMIKNAGTSGPCCPPRHGQVLGNVACDNGGRDITGNMLV